MLRKAGAELIEVPAVLGSNPNTITSTFGPAR